MMEYRTCDEVIIALKNVAALPRWARPQGRTIYEAAGGGRQVFFIDFASFLGESVREVPRALIVELERKGAITRTYPHQPKINAWRIASKEEGTTK